jgi:hypothetical protein
MEKAIVLVLANLIFSILVGGVYAFAQKDLWAGLGITSCLFLIILFGMFLATGMEGYK